MTDMTKPTWTRGRLWVERGCGNNIKCSYHTTQSLEKSRLFGSFGHESLNAVTILAREVAHGK